MWEHFRVSIECLSNVGEQNTFSRGFCNSWGWTLTHGATQRFLKEEVEDQELRYRLLTSIYPLISPQENQIPPLCYQAKMIILQQNTCFSREALGEGAGMCFVTELASPWCPVPCAQLSCRKEQMVLCYLVPWAQWASAYRANGFRFLTNLFYIKPSLMKGCQLSLVSVSTVQALAASSPLADTPVPLPFFPVNFLPADHHRCTHSLASERKYTLVIKNTEFRVR